jgi:large subunit ribosomal protein L10
MPSQKNIQQVEKLSEKLNTAKAVYITDFAGLNVGNITDLRSKFFEASVEFTVAKNTLIKLAAESNKIEGLDEFLSGPTALAISYEEPTAPARVIKAFAKEHNKPKVKGVLFEGEILDGAEFKRIANLPDKDQLLATLVAMLKNPITKFVSAMNSPMVNLVSSLNSLKEKKS